MRRAVVLATCLLGTLARAQFESRVQSAPGVAGPPPLRATSEVTRDDLEARLPRATPDALGWEPGVFIQQTAHGQGSAYLRGLTGQQTLLLFDGIRLNNATFRQGPNQYLFTVDARTLERLEVQRGGASTRFGSDALGGVILGVPLQPTLSSARTVAPRLVFRGASADHEVGGRAQLEAAGRVGGALVGFLGGVGLRRSGPLTGPPVENPDPSTPLGPRPWVPRYAPDDRTQLGTGFRELTADARLVVSPRPSQRLTLAAYLYRQYDVPRTDQCPAPTAPADSCLTQDEQFRDLVYAAWEGELGPAARRARVVLSWQAQHERRRLDRPGQFTRLVGVDDVDSLGLVARAESARLARGRTGLRVAYGLDLALDLLRSRAATEYTDVGITSPLSRGQYLEGSRYATGGVFLDAVLELGRRVTLESGGRAGLVVASAPADPQSGTRAVERTWTPPAAHLGLTVKAHPTLALMVSVDHSFRAPNLDDLTARQQTGPGFQFENAALEPERATGFEVGARLRTRPLEAELWLFETLLSGLILRSPRAAEDCPPETPQCLGSWSRLQLVNAPSLAELRGAELAVRARPHARVRARATIAYAWGEGPRVGASPLGLEVRVGERVPLSRVPPLNGTVEVWAAPLAALEVGAALRWAARQDRLALADYADARIPRYGTPGYAVVDLRGRLRLPRGLSATVIVENLFDAPFRAHGSSVNGPGRGVALQLEAAPR